MRRSPIAPPARPVVLARHRYLAFAIGCCMWLITHGAHPDERDGAYLDAIGPVPMAEWDVSTAEGHVILYGQSISPPYRFKVDGQRLLLNGVVIEPPVVPPWRSVPDVEPTESDRAVAAMLARAASAARELIRSNRQAALAETLISREPLISDARWIGPDSVRLRLTLGLSIRVRIADEAPPARTVSPTAQLESMMRQGKRALDEGAVVLWGYGVEIVVPQVSRAWFEEELARLSARGEEVELTAFIGDEEIAREILYFSSKPGTTK